LSHGSGYRHRSNQWEVMSSELFFSNLLLAATDQIVLTTPLEF